MQEFGRPSILAEKDTVLAARILAVISRYQLESQNAQAQTPNAKFLEQITTRIALSEPVLMCLPAFPFKSPNTSSKVLGSLPDKAEEFALAHLNGLCAAIADIYAPGARLMIISDGLVYNGGYLLHQRSPWHALTVVDLLGVPDSSVWAYGEALRAMVSKQGLKHIEFSRLKDITTVDMPDKLDQIKYVSNATNFRHALLSQFGDPAFDISSKLREDEDTCLTYRGYIKFLATDLQDVYPVGPGRTKSQYKKGIEYIAKQMLFRGDVRRCSHDTADLTIANCSRRSPELCGRPSSITFDCPFTHRTAWKTRFRSVSCLPTHHSLRLGTLLSHFIETALLQQDAGQHLMLTIVSNWCTRMAGLATIGKRLSCYPGQPRKAVSHASLSTQRDLC